MSEKIRKLKENASRLIAKGKLAEAADEYVKIVKTDPRDLTARQKLAEIFARMGKVHEAVLEYQSVAGSYAADGLLLKAIAVCKIILQIDPSHKETQQILAELSTRRRGDAVAVEMPKSMSTAIAPGQKRSASDIRGAPASEIRRVAPATLEANAQAAQFGRRQRQPIEVPPATEAIELDMGRAAQEPASQAAPLDEIAIDVDISGEGAAVVVGTAVPAPGSAPIEISIMSAEGLAVVEGDGGAPIVVGTASSQEGAPLPPNLPPDEAPAGSDDAAMLAALAGFAAADATPGAAAEGTAPAYAVPPDEIAVGDDDSDIIELTEPARVDVDRVPPIPLFSDLARDAFIALTERMELRVAGKDDVLVQEGERGTSMFIIIQGRVVVKRSPIDGAEAGDVVLAELNDGAFFGEMALLSDAPRMASVVCADDTMLFEISRELLADITREHPSVGEVMKKFHKNRLLTNLLKTSPIFQPFSTRDKKALIEKFKSRAVDDGTYLITRERPGEGLYVVLSGRCEVLDTKDGHEVLLAELKEGDIFGEMSMLWHKKTCASVKAASPCVVLRLPREAFNEIIMTHPQILETLTAISERRQKQNQDLKAPPVHTDFLV